MILFSLVIMKNVFKYSTFKISKKYEHKKIELTAFNFQGHCDVQFTILLQIQRPI